MGISSRDGTVRWYKECLVLLMVLVCCRTQDYVGNSVLMEPVPYIRQLVQKPILILGGKTLAEILLDEYGLMSHCRLHELDEEADAEPLIQNSGLQVEYYSFRNMVELINNCTKLERPALQTVSTNNTSVEAFDSYWSSWSLWNGILPGTKWCGVGDIADTFEQLGSEVDVDACCRAHDLCPVKLKAFRAGYGIINLSLYTKSHCDCDRDFLSCLKNVTSKMADAVGRFYFNVVQVQCLKERREFVCVKNRTDVEGFNTCVKWSPDEESNKMQISIAQLKY